MMGQCKTLSDYAYFVSKVRYYSVKGYTIEKAVDFACIDCIEKDILKEFLLKNRSEVVNMFLVDYKPSLQRKMDREEGREKGRAEGHEETLVQVVKNMLAHGMQDEDIIALTECSQDFIDQLRKE